MYVYAEVIALRQTLRGGVATASAVRLARETLSTRDDALVAALGGYDRRLADAVMEKALGSRSIQECVDAVLLPALEQIARRGTLDSAAWAFAAPWGVDWLRRATRLGAERRLPLSIVLGDASRDALDPDASHIRALELFCIRDGARLISLSVRGAAGLGQALRARRPDLIVIAGGQIADGAVAAWAQAARAAMGPAPIALYRRADRLAQAPTTGTTVLPARASHAHGRLIELAGMTSAIGLDDRARSGGA